MASVKNTGDSKLSLKGLFSYSQSRGFAEKQAYGNSNDRRESSQLMISRHDTSCNIKSHDPFQFLCHIVCGNSL